MQAVILCGGKGGRIQVPETGYLPKPLVPIGGRAILHRLMDWYSIQGINEFVLALGYKSQDIIHAEGYNPKWEVTFVETGDPDKVQTGGRLKRLYDNGWIKDTFLLSYCDIITDVSIESLKLTHSQSNKRITLTVTNPKLPFGITRFVNPDSSEVKSFLEKPIDPEIWANEGVYIVDPIILKTIKNDCVVFESEIIPKLVQDKKVNAYKHNGMWLAVNTSSDWNYANELWYSNQLEWFNISSSLISSNSDPSDE